MESLKGGNDIWPIPEEEEEGACGPAGTNDNPSQSKNVEWGVPSAADTRSETHVDKQSTKDEEKRESTIRVVRSRGGGSLIICSGPSPPRQYSSERNPSEQGHRKSDQVKNESGKTSGGVGSKTPESGKDDCKTSSDGTMNFSKIWTKSSIIIPNVAAPEQGKKRRHVIETDHSHSKSWSAPGGYTAYFDTVSQQMQDNNGLITARTSYNRQASYGNGNNTDANNNNKKQFNKAPGSVPYARGNQDFKNESLQNRRYWYGRQPAGIPTSFGQTRHYATNDTRRYGRGVYHNTAKSSAQHPVEQRGDQRRVFFRSARNYFRGAGNCSRGPVNCSRGTGDFSRRGNTYPRGGRRPYPRRGVQNRRQTSQERNDRGHSSYSRQVYVNRTSARGEHASTSVFNDHAQSHVPPVLPDFSQPPPSVSQPGMIPKGETYTNMNDGLGKSSFVHGFHDPNSQPNFSEPPPELLLHRMTMSDNSPCDYVSVRVHAHQSSPHCPDEQRPYEFQGAQWPMDFPFHVPRYIRPQCLCPQLRAAEAMGYVWCTDARPVMPVMVPQNPPVGTPVYYQQPVMGAAWSPYVPLVETYNEMPCYPADYGNSGYYAPSYGNPVYQNNPMEFMPPNPAGDPAGHVQNNVVGEAAVPPQNEVPQNGEAQNRPPVCAQCGGCGTCGHCTCHLRPRTSSPLLNHGGDPQPSTSRTPAEERPGPINFGAQKSLKDDGSDLPKDVATLRFFFNLGVDAHRSASRFVPNGNTRPEQASEDSSSGEHEIGDEISSLVGRLHRVVFRQSPDPKDLAAMNEAGRPFRWTDEDDH